MTGTEKLRKENQSLRNEIADLKAKLQKISENVTKMEEQHGRRPDEREMSPERVHSVEFVAQQYDGLTKFKVEVEKQIQELDARVNEISILCDRIMKSIEASEAYSYQFNLKIVGVPNVTERESPQQTANFCLKLFMALGVENVSLNDIDLVHRVPSRVASNRPNAIICKFVRRLAKENVLANRRNVNGLSPVDLGFNSDVDVSHINLYEHLTPRLQELLYESKKFKDAKSYKYCWAKNGFVFLRKTDISTPLKLKRLEDLRRLSASI